MATTVFDSPIALLVLLVLPLLLVLPVVVGVLAWVALRPGEGEPPARARLRRTSGTSTAVATALAAAVLTLSAPLALVQPELGAAGAVLAGLLYAVVLRVGGSLAARPSAVRRTALLVPPPGPPLRAPLRGLLLAGAGGLLVLMASAATGAGGTDLLPAAPVSTLPAAVGGLLLVLVVLPAARQTSRRSPGARLHPEVDAAGRARAEHRLLRAGAASAMAALGLVLLGNELQARAAAGDAVAVGCLVLGGLLVVVGAVLALLRPPALPMRPDTDEVAALGVDAGTGGR